MPAKPRGREALLLRLVDALADHPGASMAELAAIAGVSRATLFRYFPSRQNMLLAIAEACVTSATEAFDRARPDDEPFEDNLLRLIEELLPIAELYAYVDRHLRSDESTNARMQPLRDSLIRLFQQWQQDGILRVDMPAAWLVESLASLLRNAATMIRSGRLARHDAAYNVLELLCRGMKR